MPTETRRLVADGSAQWPTHFTPDLGFCPELRTAHCILSYSEGVVSLSYSPNSNRHSGKVVSELKRETWKLIEGRVWSHFEAVLRDLGSARNGRGGFGLQITIEAALGKTLFPLFWALEGMPNPGDTDLATKIFDNWLNLPVEKRLWLGLMGFDDKPGTAWRWACWAGLAEAGTFRGDADVKFASLSERACDENWAFREMVRRAAAGDAPALDWLKSEGYGEFVARLAA